jgi:hypothetical protein
MTNPNQTDSEYPSAELSTKWPYQRGRRAEYNREITGNPCPTCGAQSGFDCYSRNGKRAQQNGASTPHAARNRKDKG